MPPKRSSKFEVPVKDEARLWRRSSKFRNFIFFLIVFILLLSIVKGSVRTGSIVASETSLDRAQQDYTFQYTKYRDAEEKYQVAKSTFETFKTATAKGEAYVKTKEYLIQIDNVFVAYLLFVKEQGNYIDWGRKEPQKTEVFELIESEITYFQDHPKQIEATETLEELPALAKEAKDHIENALTKKINKTLTLYELAETVSAYDKFVELADKVDVLVLDRLQKDPSPFLANWSSAIKDIKEKALVPLDIADVELNKYQGSAGSEDLNRITQLAKQSKEEILKSKPLFEEAMRIL